MTVILFLCGVLFAPAAAQFDSNTGNARETIVHLFSWKWEDVAKECERFLGPNGYGGVQISPPNDHAMLPNPAPWWERYQVVGYDLVSRSGDTDQFQNMVETCNQANVRIYADAVFNHMAYFEERSASGTTYQRGTNYPTVPYTEEDFNYFYGTCVSGGEITDSSSANDQRNCDILALPDLAVSRTEVQEKIAGYLNRMIDIGVAGFRIDFARYMFPEDLEAIYDRLNDLNSQYFPEGSKPFIYQEFIDSGVGPVKARDYTDNGLVTEFNYGPNVAKAVRRETNMTHFINSLLSQSLNLLPDDKALNFIDSHYTQRKEGFVENVITFKNARDYRMANALMLAFPYGVNRIMSSFQFEAYDDSPPSSSNGFILSPQIGGDGQCTNDFICEHRWPVIRNMVRFKNAVTGTSVVNKWDNGKDQVAFGRGEKGFFVVNNEPNNRMVARLLTNLPEGEYCDVIHGDIGQDGQCSGPTVAVDTEGYADFNIDSGDDSMVAIHVDALVTDGGEIPSLSLVLIAVPVISYLCVF